MRMVIVNGLPRDRSADLYDSIAHDLRARGVDAVVVHGRGAVESAVRGCNLVFGNCVLPFTSAGGTRIYAGAALPRPASLRLLEEAGVPTMQWALAASRRDVRALFERWQVEHVLLKPSFTFGGRQVRVVRRHALWRLRWNREVDIFCREVNPDDGDVYKAELLAGRVLIAFKSASPPIRARRRQGILRGLAGAYGERRLWDPPADLASTLAAFSGRLAARGIGHVSVDLMRRPDGALAAIELNLSRVATWWTRQFPRFREQYAEALCDLATGATAPP